MVSTGALCYCVNNLFDVICCIIEDGKTMLIDVNDKTKDEILNHLLNVVGKTK